MGDKKKKGADGQEKEVMISKDVHPMLDTADAPGAQGGWSLNINGEVELFGVKLVGIMEKSGSGLKILIIPKTEEPQKIVLDTLVRDLARKFGCDIKAADVEERINAIGDFLTLDLNALYLRQVFCYYDSANSAKEFAISLEIRGAEVKDAPAQLFAINKIAFSIWNTPRQKIIEKMQLILVDDYLGEATAPSAL